MGTIEGVKSLIENISKIIKLNTEKFKTSKLELILNILKLYTYQFVYKYLLKYQNKEKLEEKIFLFGYTLYGCDINCIIDIFVNQHYIFPIRKKRITILDIGSNTGISVIFFKKYYPSSKIYAFEPNPFAFMYLKKNVKENKLKNVYIFNIGISDKKEKKYLVFEKYNDISARISNAISKGKRRNIIRVKLVPISIFIKKYNIKKIDILKIDVEGYEGRIIRDLEKNKLLDKIENIVLEYHWTHDKKNSLSKILEILEKNGFYYIIPEFIKYNSWCSFLAIIKASKNKNLL